MAFLDKSEYSTATMSHDVTLQCVYKKSSGTCSLESKFNNGCIMV